MASATELIGTVDIYDLLAITPSATESEIRRAYRKTSLLYHPDKVTPTPETLDKFQLLQTALTILTDVAEKAKYDAGREAKLRRRAEAEALDSRRQKMKEDLERGEAGFASSNSNKRTWSEREMKIQRIAEENRKKMAEATARKKKEAEKAAAEAAEAAEAQSARNQQQQSQSESTAADGKQSADEIDRCVKVRWIKEGDGLDIDDTFLAELFPTGEIENVVIMKDKKRKIDVDGQKKEKKVVLGNAVLVFATLAAAKRAVANGPIDELQSIEWAKKEGD